MVLGLFLSVQIDSRRCGVYDVDGYRAENGQMPTNVRSVFPTITKRDGAD